MKMTFRYYGTKDPVTLTAISQIPTVRSIVSAVYDVPAGGVWSRESIAALKADAEAHGLTFEVVESVPVPEDIKLGNENAPALIENYCENVRRLGEAGVKCICYNFMPVFDWLRSELHRPAADGSNSLAYDEQTVLAMDPAKGGLSLPGWDESYTLEGLRDLLKKYEDMTEEKLSTYLYSADVPDPELIIRPSGEKRISNFLLWQSAYSEFVFMNVLWPDFGPEHLDQAIEEYRRRNRRFGGV